MLILPIKGLRHLIEHLIACRIGYSKTAVLLGHFHSFNNSRITPLFSHRIRLTYRTELLTLQDKHNFVKNNEYSTCKVDYFYFGREGFLEELESAMPGSFGKGGMGREARVIFLTVSVPRGADQSNPVPFLWTHFFSLFPLSFPVIKLSLFMQYFLWGLFTGSIPAHSPSVFADDESSLAILCESLGAYP